LSCRICAATMRRPSPSKRDRISPMAFFATASGLIMDSVRSTAMLAPGCVWIKWKKPVIAAPTPGTTRQARYCTVESCLRTVGAYVARPLCIPPARHGSNRKRFAAATGMLRARIIETKNLIQAFAAEIHCGTGQHRQVFVIDNDTGAFGAENMVGSADFVGIVHGVHVTAAAGFSHPDPQPE